MLDKAPQLLAKLRLMVSDMENDLGLGELSEASRLIYCAAAEISERKRNDDVCTAELRHHALLRDVSRPTFFRALAELIKKDYLARPQDDTRGTVRFKAR
jgi:hypothetical protein